MGAGCHDSLLNLSIKLLNSRSSSWFCCKAELEYKYAINILKTGEGRLKEDSFCKCMYIFPWQQQSDQEVRSLLTCQAWQWHLKSAIIHLMTSDPQWPFFLSLSLKSYPALLRHLNPYRWSRLPASCSQSVAWWACPHWVSSAPLLWWSQ